MGWRPVSAVFRGGSAELKALYGKRVKVARTCFPKTFELHGEGVPVELRVGEEGFVGYPAGTPQDLVVIGFARSGRLPPTLAALQRSNDLKSVVVNWPTFIANFQIDA